MVSSVIALTCAAGCGSAAPPARDAADAERQAEVRQLRRRGSEQRARVQELEGQLALASAEARDLRDEFDRIARTEEPRPQGGDDGGWDEPPPSDEAGWEEEVPEEGGQRPVLRLYGTRPGVAAGPVGPPAPLILPLAPPGTPDRLPVVPLPGQDDIREARTPVPAVGIPRRAAPVARSDEGTAGYRRALALVRDRQFDQALNELDQTLSANPGHARADDLHYWRGVVHYARRSYGRALEDFERVVSAYPTSDKVPDALLKIGMCHQRMGDSDRARSYFQQVRERFPNSVAARLASREEAS